MASYNIVLNLGGNASTRIEKLADDLRRANTQAEKLKNTLNTMPKLGRIVGGVGGGVGGGGGAAQPLGDRSWYNIFGGTAQIGTTFSTSGGINTTFRLLGRANAILGALVSAGSMTISALKPIAAVTKARYTLGAKGINYLAGVLTSSEMGEGIRLLQRRQQARLGFGAGYAQAQERADLLAASFGIDPSNVIASMNVLSGMPIGKTGQRISLGLAERLTQAGGLISQQSGVPFERVMTNLQQMMSQTVPTIRDIREMLNAAPILSKYALQEMEKRGISGVSSMDWLKNQANIMTVLERFMSENPAIATMQARGIVSRSKTQFYATLAENPAWLNIATQYEGLMEAAAKGLSSLITSVAGNRSLVTSIERIKILFNDIPSILDKWADKADKFIRKWGGIIGFDVDKYETEAARSTEDIYTIRGHIRKNLPFYKGLYAKYGMTVDKDETAFITNVERFLGAGVDLSKYVKTVVPTEMTAAQRAWLGKTLLPYTPATAGMITSGRMSADELYAFFKKNEKFFYQKFGWSVSDDYGVSGRLVTRIDPKLKDIADVLASGNVASGGGGLASGAMPTTGDDISGYGRDRKALIINFNQPIVEWTSTIESTQPEDVVNEVADNIEGMTSRALQIALLGASSRMTTNW